MISLESKIEGVLFYKGDEVSIETLSSILSAPQNEIEEALVRLGESYKDRGLVLVRNNSRVVLGISSELSSILESIRKEELSKELSKSALETISIILYRNGVTRSEIDYIRGVNSSFILRNLLVRGLIEKRTDKSDSRRLLYYPTTQTLAYMGLSSIESLPQYSEVSSQLSSTLLQMNENQ